MATVELMTVEEFARVNTAETEDYELVEGEAVPLASVTPLHSRVRRRMQCLLEDYFERNPGNEPIDEIDCRLA